MSSVHIRDVRKSFGSFEVLHGVTIPIYDGEFVVPFERSWLDECQLSHSKPSSRS